MTEQVKASTYETFRHIERVRALLNAFAIELLRRGEEHDQSKLEEPEVSAFAAAPPLAGLTFNSPEYKASKESLAKALEHHYARNAHHPQHWKSGVNDMTLVDIVEMFLDWKASSERHNDGNILKSIEENARTFGIDSQLRLIFENTARGL